MTERRTDRAAVATNPATAEPHGFRPASRRRARIAAGAILVAIGVGGNLLLYASLDDSTEVLQVVSNVRAGEQITDADLRIVEVELDATVPVIPASEIGRVVGQYARVYIAAGTLMVDVLIQPTPLVAAGQGVVAVEIRPTQVPRDVRERSRVLVVVLPDDDEPPIVVEGRVVAVSDRADAGEVISLSVEVDQADGPTVAAGDDVRVVLLDPAIDPALEAVPVATQPPDPIASSEGTEP